MKKGKRADEKEEREPSPSRCARHLSLGERLNDSLPKALPVGELREAVRGVKKERRGALFLRLIKNKRFIR